MEKLGQVWVFLQSEESGGVDCSALGPDWVGGFMPRRLVVLQLKGRGETMLEFIRLTRLYSGSVFKCYASFIVKAKFDRMFCKTLHSLATSCSFTANWTHNNFTSMRRLGLVYNKTELHFLSPRVVPV